MTSFKFVLRKSKAKSNGEIPIYLRITINRKSRFYSTQIAVLESDWDEEAQRVKPSHPLASELNSILIQTLSGAYVQQNKLLAEDKLSAKNLKNNLVGKEGLNVFDYAEQYIKELMYRDQIYEEKKYKVLLGKLEKFWGHRNLTFSEIDVVFLKEFDTFMISEYGNKTNTRHKMLQKLKRLFHLAIQEDRLSMDKNPFLKFKIKRAKTTKSKLTISQIQDIEDLKLEQGSWLWHSRNYFLFSFYCAGIRFGDLCQLRWNNISREGHLSYEMDKTGRKKMIKVPPQGLKILGLYKTIYTKNTDFIFPLLDNGTDYSSVRYLKSRISARNALVNKCLKKIAQKISLNEKLSFHVARHSFADFARTQGVDLYSISKALGHSSLSVTEGYLKSLDQESVDEAIVNLFENCKKV